jgi:glycosyltransferase involved in cell wall biosynthesis
MKRILYVHNDYASPSGEEDSAQSIVDLLRANGHEVSWFRRSSAEIAGSFAGKVRAFFAGIHNPFAARILAKQLDQIKPHIVQVQNIYPLLSSSIFRVIKDRRIPVVMRCPNYRLFCPNGLHLKNGRVCEKCLCFGREFWCIVRNCEDSVFKSTGYALRNAFARVTKRILNSVDMYIVQTEFQKRKFVERGIPEDRIGIVPAFVPQANVPTRNTLGDLVTFVGRVSPEKGVDEFLNAAEAMPNIPFAIAGNYDRMAGMPDRSPSNVQWLGFLGPDELDGVYLRSRIVVIPSRCYEGFPSVITRAMTFARPVVASCVGAMTSVVEHNVNGLFFEAGNAGDLKAKLSYLYNNEDLCWKLGNTAQRMASLKYSAEITYKSLMDVYEKAAQCSFG